MTTPEDFEQELVARLEGAGGTVAGEGTTLDGVVVRHRQRVRARRARQGALAAVAAGVLAVAGIGFAAGGEDGGTTQVAAEGSPAAEGAPAAVAADVCAVEADVVVFVRPEASEEQIQAVGQVLDDRFGTTAVHFVGQEEAYEEALALFAGQPVARDVLKPEDVPASFRIAPAGSGLDPASLRDELRELLSGRAIHAVEVVDPEVVSIEAGGGPGAEGPPDSVSTTTAPALAGTMLTEEQVQALVAYIRGLPVEGEIRGESTSSVPCVDDDAATGETTGTGPAGPDTTTPPQAPTTQEAPAPPPGDAPASTTVPAWPTATTPQHGDEAWAAYLAVVAEAEGPAAPDLRRAGDQARDVGYVSGPSDLACDQGAAEALGLDPAGSYLGLPLYFATEADARLFAELLRTNGGGEVRGIALVQTFCLD